MIEINYNGIEKNEEYEKIIVTVLEACYAIEKIKNQHLYTNIILTTPQEIRKINQEYRKIDKETDVLSFPMFEKQELLNVINSNQEDILGDIVISIEQVKKQAIEYGHSLKRELAYMAAHGFYHLMGYDHMEEADKIKMREKEEILLNKLSIVREESN